LKTIPDKPKWSQKTEKIWELHALPDKLKGYWSSEALSRGLKNILAFFDQKLFHPDFFLPISSENHDFDPTGFSKLWIVIRDPKQGKIHRKTKPKKKM
jgi:hypothetical protein